MLSMLLVLALAAEPLPLPSVDGKPLAVAPGQTAFLVPLRFEKVRAFYATEVNGPKVSASVKRENGAWVMTLMSKRSKDAWKKAVIRETRRGTEVVVTPVLRIEEQQVEGTGKPAVELILGRSRDVDRAVEKIGDLHLEAIRK